MKPKLSTKNLNSGLSELFGIHNVVGIDLFAWEIKRFFKKVFVPPIEGILSARITTIQRIYRNLLKILDIKLQIKEIENLMILYKTEK